MIRKLSVLTVVFLMTTALLVAQTAPKKPRPVKYLITAVLNDGKMIEPVAYIQEGKLLPPANGSDDANIITAFSKTYYPKGKVYSLIFGGKLAGTATVTSADPKSECMSNMANVVSKTTRTPLKGNVMALASNAPLKKPGSGVRRLPTASEKEEVEELVRADYAKNGVTATKTLRYQNLTALDVDSDGKAELVGSYWVETSAKSRALLAFIAEKNADGKYEFGWSNFASYKEEEVMSGEISALDSGVYHERLLDIFDVDGDGVSEIFTYIMSFEGAGFNVYRRQAGKWVASFEGSNYHCGF